MFIKKFPFKTNLHEKSMSVFLPSIHFADRKSACCNMSAKSYVYRVSDKLSSICLSTILSNVIKVWSSQHQQELDQPANHSLTPGDTQQATRVLLLLPLDTWSIDQHHARTHARTHAHTHARTHTHT